MTARTTAEKLLAVVAAAQALLDATTPFVSALEVDHGVDGEALWETLRGALAALEAS